MELHEKNAVKRHRGGAEPELFSKKKKNIVLIKNIKETLS